MNNRKMMTKALGGLIVIGLGSLGGAWAHEAGGSLGSSEVAVDKFVIACSNGSSATRLQTAIQGITLNGPLVTVTVEKDGKSVTTTDPKNHDKKSSTLVELPGGEGAYNFTIQKAPNQKSAIMKRKVVYSATFHCMTGDVHTDTSDPIFQVNG